MLPDTLTITLYDTSTRQRVSLPSTSALARQKTTIFVDDENKAIHWIQLDTATYSDRNSRYPRYSEAYQTMLASENILHRDWDSPEEDAAWANL